MSNTTNNLIIGKGPANAAKNIRRELAVSFPGVTFRVKTSRYAGGNSINIYWIDGPTASEVENIADRYKLGEFDGMTDSYGYCNDEFTDTYGGAMYIHCNREFSEGFVAELIDAIATKFGAQTIPTPEDYLQGRTMTISPYEAWQGYGSGSWQEVIWRAAATVAA